MAKKSEGPGIQSAAGLIRYFDEEEKDNIKIPPIAILILTFAVGAAVLAARIIWPY